MAFINDLLQAIKTGDNALVVRLIHECNDVNEDRKDHKTALGHFVKLGNKAIVKLLLGKGANMVVDSHSNATAIHFAAAVGDMDMIELLVQCGGDINAKTKGELTAMHWAARENRYAEEHELMLHKFIELGADFDAKVAEAYANSSLGRLGFCKVLAILGNNLDWSHESLINRFWDDYDFNMLFESDIPILQIAAMLNVLQGLIKSPEFENKDKYIDQVSNKLDKLIQDIDLITSIKSFDVNANTKMLDLITGLGYFLEIYQNVPDELKGSKLYAQIEGFKSQLDYLIEPLTARLKEMQAHNYRLYFKSIRSDDFHLDQLKSYSDIQYEVKRISYKKKIWSYIKNKFQDEYAQLSNSVEGSFDFCLIELPKLIDASQESHESKLKHLYEVTNEVARGYVKEFIDPKIVALQVLYWSQQKLPKELKRDLNYFLNPLGEPENEEYVFNTLKLLPPEESKQAIGKLPNEA